MAHAVVYSAPLSITVEMTKPRLRSPERLRLRVMNQILPAIKEVITRLVAIVKHKVADIHCETLKKKARSSLGICQITLRAMSADTKEI